MTLETRAPFGIDPAADARPAQRLATVGAGIAAAAAALGFGLRGIPAAAITAVNLGVLGMLVAGFGVTRRPKDGLTLLIASATALLASLATHPDWDSIRLMQWVMAGFAAVCAGLLQLPRTYQRIAVSLFVLYHFAGIVSAITSPPPSPWMTSHLWARVFRPHLEFSYVNNAYQFYSPQPGPANILWFCLYREDGTCEWLKVPRRNERLDPLGTEYYRRLSLTERVNQNVPMPFGPPQDSDYRRKIVSQDYPMHPEMPDNQQFRAPGEHSRQLLAGYARHVAFQHGPISSIKIYLTQHRMLSQLEYAQRKDPYDRDTYLPFFVGEFDADGKLLVPLDPLLYWVVPIFRQPDGGVKNYVADHARTDHAGKSYAGSDPFEQ
jgi:hypothetical protein